MIKDRLAVEKIDVEYNAIGICEIDNELIINYELKINIIVMRQIEVERLELKIFFE